MIALRMYLGLTATALLSACSALMPPTTTVAQSAAPAVATTTASVAKTASATATTLAPKVTAPSAKIAPTANATPNTTPNAASPPSTGVTAAAPAAAAGATPPLKPFADVIKEATVTKGLLTTYQKDDKVWLELLPEQFDMPLAMSINITHGIGEKGIYGNMMGAYGAAGRDVKIVTFHRHSPSVVQLLALNTSVGPRDKTPMGFAVDHAYSDSLLGSAPIASAPHPERKSVLLEINPIFISDLPHASFQLEQSFRQSYSFDARNSSFHRIRNSAEQLTLNTKLHYGLARFSVPAPGSPTPMTPPPSMLPDIRSLFLGVQYNFAKLPDTVMPPRLADQRVGYFNTTVYDYTNNEQRTPKTRFVNRWRLEKQDPQAALSPPKKQIVYWLDKNIPEKYRLAITEGILLWNKAFEKIGFKDAVLVKQQSEKDDFDTADMRHASVRWFVGRDVPFGARGPSVVDPRSGEILDADIELSDELTRVYTTRYLEDTPRPVIMKSGGAACDYAETKFSEVAFTLGLLEARGDLQYGTPQAEKYVFDAIKDIMAHEVGHTLGLRHNFRASTIYTEAQISDPEFTKINGLSGSVMDYNPINIGLPSQKQAAYFMTTLGPYDYWAIEYGYSALPRETESVALAKIAGRNAEPLLAYATDEDAGGWAGIEGIDPEVNRSDLTNDPLAHYGKRAVLIREMWDRLQARETPTGQSYEYLRRNFDRGFMQFDQITQLTAKYVGGVNLLRDYAGTGRLPINPVAADKQRAAMNLIAENIFSEHNFRYAPTFLNRLSIDYLLREDQALAEWNSTVSPSNLSLPDRILKLQRDVLNKLTSDGVAKRLVDSQYLSADANQPLSLDELYGTLQSKIWSELDSGTPLTAPRRALQWESLRWLVTQLKKESGQTPSDARVIVRMQAKRLLAKLESVRSKAAAANAANDSMRKPAHAIDLAHYEEAHDQLKSALNAISTRAGA